jgi:hypothetical protein
MPATKRRCLPEKSREKGCKSTAPSVREKVQMCESAQRGRIVAQFRTVHDFRKAAAVASTSCATSISLRFLALAVF